MANCVLAGVLFACLGAGSAPAYSIPLQKTICEGLFSVSRNGRDRSYQVFGRVYQDAAPAPARS